MNPVFLSDSVYLRFGTSSSTTGAATNADSTPTVTVAEDGVDLGYAPVVTNLAVGLYQVQIDATAGNGFEAGRRYAVHAVATVGGVTGRDGIGEFEVLAMDLNTSLDAAISSRMATFTLPANFAALAITAGGIVDADVETWRGSIPNILIAGRVDANAQVVGDKTGYSLTQAFPANFAALVIKATGIVDANVEEWRDVAPNVLVSGRVDALAELTAAAIDAIWDEVMESGFTGRQMIRGFAAALLAKASGLDTTTAVFRDIADTKDRITATVDASGNRSAVTLDLT